MSKYRTKTVKFPVDTDMDKLVSKAKKKAKKLKFKSVNEYFETTIRKDLGL